MLTHHHYCLRRLMFGLLAPMVLASIARADYRDPIDLDAGKIAAAEQSLLLDVTRAGERLVAVGERGHILYSDDEGTRWLQAEVPSRAHLNAVTFVDAQKGWAVGEDAVILRTVDGGGHWQRQFDDRDAEQKGPLLDVRFNNDRDGVAVGVFNKIYATDDGGNSWRAVQERIDNLDEWHLIAMAAGGESRLYIASEMGLIFRSVDGGQSFEPLQTDHDGSFHGILARQGADGSDQLVLMGVGGVLVTSTDGGQQWNLIETHTEAGLAGATWLADDQGALIVGADGVLIALDADLQTASKYQTDNGLPLSSTVQVADGSLVMVGLGGIQAYRFNRQAQRSAPLTDGLAAGEHHE